MPKISRIHARQILDSRGNPTVEVDVQLSDGAFGRAAVPSGASTGAHEAVELRDNDPEYYLGKGVQQAVDHVNEEISKFLLNNDPFDQTTLDNEMILRDATKNAGRLGANAILGVSLAVSKAAASSLKLPYYKYISQLYHQHSGQTLRQDFYLPRPLFNVLNGGAHTDWQSTDIQEFMIIPVETAEFSEHLRWGAEIYHHLDKVLEKHGYSNLVGDEGGFAPALKSNQEAIEIILEAIDAAGYQAGKQVALGIDAAMSELYENGTYTWKVQKGSYSTEQLHQLWSDLIRQYPIMSLEDGFAEDDWEGWSNFQQEFGSTLQIVGDDLLATNLARIDQAIIKKACNTLLMKVNQIGTLTESLQAICAARQAGWNVIVSHRSGETEDASISDIVVGTGAGQIKAGAPSRSERLAKYNQLLRIEEELDH